MSATGDSHALQSRRRQNPGDQGTRAARAPAAGISLLGENRGTDLSHAAGDSPPPSRVGRQGARHHRAVLDARSQGGPGIRATSGRNEKRTRAGPHHRHARLFREAPHDRGLEGADQRSGSRRQLSDQQGAAPRALASGLSCAVGFKNGTDGNVRIAVDALKAARTPHHFLSVTKEGHSAIVSTNGNEDCHIILRGGKHPNYDAASVDAAAKELAAAGLEQRLMVDCSHSNSQKMYQRQIDVAREVARQVATGEDRVIGVMVESHLKAGRQDLVPGKPLVYGQSITDACIGWEDSVPLLRNLAEAVRKRRLVKAEES